MSHPKGRPGPTRRRRWWHAAAVAALADLASALPAGYIGDNTF